MQCKRYQRHQQTVFILASCKADRMIIIRSHGIRALNATIKCALQSMVACEKRQNNTTSNDTTLLNNLMPVEQITKMWYHKTKTVCESVVERSSRIICVRVHTLCLDDCGSRPAKRIMNGQACAVTRKHIMITGHIAPRKFTGEEKENNKKK